MIGEPQAAFVDALARIRAPRVVELGVHRSVPDRSTRSLDWIPSDARYTGSDFEAGEDVDVVADAHDLAPFADAWFDALIARSVWEHLARPWVAAEAVARVVRPGGLLAVVTHQTFMVHGYPNDYFRFTDEALRVLFADAFEEIACGYEYPCRIIPPPEVTEWGEAPAWLNVFFIGRRR